MFVADGTQSFEEGCRSWYITTLSKYRLNDDGSRVPGSCLLFENKF